MAVTTAVAEHTDQPPARAPGFPLCQGLFRFWSRLAEADGCSALNAATGRSLTPPAACCGG